MTRPLLCNPRQIDDAAEILKALGHPLRLRIVAVLSEAEANVNAIAQQLDTAPAIISQQLRILRLANLVAATRISGEARYRLIDERLRWLLDCMEKKSVRAAQPLERT